MRRRAAALLLPLLLVLALIAPSFAGAATKTEEPPPGSVNSAEATQAAAKDPNVLKEKAEHPGLVPSPTFNNEKWEVGWFEDDHEYALVMVDPKTGKVTESWTGYQVAWEMARGYSGEFAHSLNSPLIWIPLCLLFFVGLCDWRKLRRVANLDLLVLLGFGVSHFFFNQGNIGLSVPLAYPVLVYLLVRCLWIGFRGRGSGLRPTWPTMWLLIAALFLMGFRVGLNMADAGAIDVGYAGVTGAHKIVHGEPLYGNFPEDIHSGDTYGPVNYAAYVPFEVIWPYTGEWDDLPAAHGASITFDVATFILLLVLGIRIRPGPDGRRLGAILAFGWAAFPYTAYVLESDSNDALVSALLVATLVLLAKPLWRGVTISLATWAKFTPLMLAPMLLTYDPDPSGEEKPWRAVLLPPGAPLRGRLRDRHRRLHALAGDRPRPQGLLRTDDRRSGRPHVPVQHLGTGRIARADPPRDPRRDRDPRDRPRLRPAPQVPAPGGRLRRRADARRGDHPAPLVLPLHRLVLPADADRAVPARADRGARRRTRSRGSRVGSGDGRRNHHRLDRLRQSRLVDVDHGAHHPDVLVGGLEAVRHLGDQRAERVLDPHPEDALPRAGHADVGDEGGAFGEDAAVGGRHVGVGAEHRGDAAVEVPAHRHLLAGHLGVEVDDHRVGVAERSRIASTASKGERATFSPTPPLRLTTSTRIPPASTVVWPRPGLPLG